MSSVQHISRTARFLATATAVTTLSPKMRRVQLTAPGFADVSWPLACDIAIVLAGGDREVRRRYTVRRAEGATLNVDAVLHGHGPGSTWAQQLQVGDEVPVFGPRGEIGIPATDWLLALTDESGLPAIAALAETALQPLTVLAEIADEGERYPLPPAAEVRWLVRGDRPAGTPDVFGAALTDLVLPAGAGYAFVLGESRAVVALRDALGDLGLNRSAVYAKGYWNLNSRAGR